MFVGEHKWEDGECVYGPLVGTEGNKTMLEKNSKAIEALQEVILDPPFLENCHKASNQRSLGLRLCWRRRDMTSGHL